MKRLINKIARPVTLCMLVLRAASFRHTLAAELNPTEQINIKKRQARKNYIKYYQECVLINNYSPTFFRNKANYFLPYQHLYTDPSLFGRQNNEIKAVDHKFSTAYDTKHSPEYLSILCRYYLNDVHEDIPPNLVWSDRLTRIFLSRRLHPSQLDNSTHTLGTIHHFVDHIIVHAFKLLAEVPNRSLPLSYFTTLNTPSNNALAGCLHSAQCTYSETTSLCNLIIKEYKATDAVDSIQERLDAKVHRIVWDLNCIREAHCAYIPQDKGVTTVFIGIIAPSVKTDYRDYTHYSVLNYAFVLTLLSAVHLIATLSICSFSVHLSKFVERLVSYTITGEISPDCTSIGKDELVHHISVTIDAVVATKGCLLSTCIYAILLEYLAYQLRDSASQSVRPNKLTESSSFKYLNLCNILPLINRLYEFIKGLDTDNEFNVDNHLISNVLMPTIGLLLDISTLTFQGEQFRIIVQFIQYVYTKSLHFTLSKSKVALNLLINYQLSVLSMPTDTPYLSGYPINTLFPAYKDHTNTGLDDYFRDIFLSVINTVKVDTSDIRLRSNSVYYTIAMHSTSILTINLLIQIYIKLFSVSLDGSTNSHLAISNIEMTNYSLHTLLLQIPTDYLLYDTVHSLIRHDFKLFKVHPNSSPNVLIYSDLLRRTSQHFLNKVGYSFRLIAEHMHLFRDVVNRCNQLPYAFGLYSDKYTTPTVTSPEYDRLNTKSKMIHHQYHSILYNNTQRGAFFVHQSPVAVARQ